MVSNVVREIDKVADQKAPGCTFFNDDLTALSQGVESLGKTSLGHRDIPKPPSGNRDQNILPIRPLSRVSMTGVLPLATTAYVCVMKPCSNRPAIFANRHPRTGARSVNTSQCNVMAFASSKKRWQIRLSLFCQMRCPEDFGSALHDKVTLAEIAAQRPRPYGT